MLDLDYVEQRMMPIDVRNRMEVRINCPECDDTKYHCYCNLQKMLYHCFKCGASGKIVDKKETSASTFDKVREQISNSITKMHHDIISSVNIEVITPNNPVKTLPHSDLILENKPEMKDTYYLRESHKAFRYLLNRGVKEDEMNKFGIRVSLEKHGRYANTIIFPIYEINAKDELKYFVCRKYDGTTPKYINAPWPKEDSVFMTGGFIQARVMVITEGIFDAIAVSKIHGFQGLAILGKQLTNKQLKLISENRSSVLIYLDEDALLHAVNMKMQLDALGCKSVVIRYPCDAADLYLKDKKLLEAKLDEANYKRIVITKS